MRKNIFSFASFAGKAFGALSLAFFTTVMLSGCGNNGSTDHDHDHDHHATEAEHEHEGEEGHDHAHEHGAEEGEHGPDIITLKPEMAERFGVTARKIEPAPFRSVLKVSGTLTDSPDETAVVVAPVAGTVTFARGISEGAQVRRGQSFARINPSAVAGGNPNASAKAALDAAKREMDRLKPLYEERLVTAQEYNAAVAAYNQARAAFSSGAAHNSASSPIGGTVISLAVPSGSFVNAGEVIATVGSASHLMLKAEVPASNSEILPHVTDARFKTSGALNAKTVSALKGKRAGAASRATTPGYIPVYFTLENDGTLVPGTTATVWLLGEEMPACLSVPVSALSEQQGLLYVYVKIDEDCYRRVPVTVGQSDGERVQILSGLEPGQEVVTNGAITVKIAGNTSAIPAHSHSH